METDVPKEDQPKRTRKVKKQVRKGDLPIVSGTNSLESSLKAAFEEKEAQMLAEDKLVADTEEKKNELETYIYELRNKLDDQYADFASDDEKSKIRTKLDATEVSNPALHIIPWISLPSSQLTLSPSRTGFTTKVMIPPRVSTSPKSTNSVLWQAQ